MGEELKPCPFCGAELQNIKKGSDSAKELLQILRLWEDLQGIENNTVFRASDGLLKIHEILRRVKIIFDNAVKEIKQLCLSQEVRS
ncbi:MAG: hypothetical protein IJQ56_07845 [Synergistaceae bacterium]|nr:hypothetical protein [Synergistaceae bacterium]